jgi:sn-glycerol 3-phosphate transport system permease protein
MIGETTFDRVLIRGGGALLALIWIAPLAYAMWAAFHPAAFEARFELTAPLTLDNFAASVEPGAVRALFPQHLPAGDLDPERQLVLCTLAAFAFARLEFPGKTVLFTLILMQLLVMPDILLVENYKTMRALGLVDTIIAIGCPISPPASRSSCCGRPS